MRNFGEKELGKNKTTPYEKMDDDCREIVDAAKKKLVLRLGHKEQSFDELDYDIIKSLDVYFFNDAKFMANLAMMWKDKLMSVNEGVSEYKEELAYAFAEEMYKYLTKHSSLKNRFNN